MKKNVGRPYPPKLSYKKAREMRKLRKKGFKLLEIANRYDVSEVTAWKVVNGRIWVEERIKGVVIC